MRAALLIVSIALFAAPASAADLSGDWEVQAMGSDREITIQQQGDKIAAHRVLWPEFQGKRYKLEHLYKGKVSGGSISGQLYVKDDEIPSFEILRAFKGRVGGGRVTLDGLPLKRTGGGGGNAAATPPPPAAKKPPPTSGGTGRTAAPPPPPPPPAGRRATAPPPPPPPRTAKPPPPPPRKPAQRTGKKTKAPKNLFAVARAEPAAGRVAQFMREGDAAFQRGDHELSLDKYRMAVKFSRRMRADMMHRMGRAHLYMKEYLQAEKWLTRALRLDPHNPSWKRDLNKAKREGR